MFSTTYTLSNRSVICLAALLINLTGGVLAQQTQPHAAADAALLRGILVSAKDVTLPATKTTTPAVDICAAQRPRHAEKEQRSTQSTNVEPGHIEINKDVIGLEADELRSVLSPFIGKPIDSALTGEISQAVIGRLNAKSRFLSDVYFPPQEVKSGQLILVIAPARVGRIVAQGQKYFNGDDLVCQIGLAPGDPVDLTVIANDLAYLNRNPWRRSDATFKPGLEPGLTDVVIDTLDEKPVRWYVGAENSGSRVTGLGRYRAGVSWGNAFGNFNHRLDYGFISASDPSRVSGHMASYTWPLANRDTMTVSANYFSSDVSLEQGLFRAQGSTTQLGLQWSRPLSVDASALSGRVGEIQAGLEYKRIGSALAFNQIPISDTVPEVMQGYVGYSVAWPDSLGRNDFSTRLTFSPGRMSRKNQDDVFDAVRVGAKSGYSHLNASYDRYFNLPRDWAFRVRAIGQYSNNALISSEKMVVSGISGVRGYYEETLSGDSGLVVNLELQTPPVRFQFAGQDTSLQGLLWVDAGRAWTAFEETNADLGRTGTQFSLVSHGVGLRMNMGRGVSLRADVGRRHSRLSNNSGNTLVHLALIVAF